MLDTPQSVLAFLERVVPEFVDVAFSYGEPGYTLDDSAATPMVILGSYWCRCDKFDDDGNGRLHGIDRHYPRTFERLESQGVELEWYDEWVVDHENNSKAYRSAPDSYSWKPSYIMTDDGTLLTADDDVETWLEWVTAGAEPRCIPGHIYRGTDLIRVGFEQWNGKFESGFHPGQDADPTAIVAEIKRWHDDVDVVFILDDTAQFDMTFTAYYRPSDYDDDAS